MKRAKVVEQKIANITKEGGFEYYFAFRATENKQPIICGHFATRDEAKDAAHAYRCGKSKIQLVCKQTRSLINS